MSGAIITIFTQFIYSYLPYLVIFFNSLFMPGDTDLGWHLKYGEYFFKTGKILKENIFSQDMTNYKWANSSWLTDIITYFIYQHGGFLSLAIAGAIVVVLIFLILTRALKLSFWDKAFIFPLLFYLEEPLFRVSFRGQLLSTLFTAILILIISEYERGNRKILFISVPLFIVWVNLHGGFLIGLVTFLIYFVLKLAKNAYLKNKTEIHQNSRSLAVVFLSFFAPLINPFGVAVYSEVIRHFGNPYQKYILEWLPLPPFSDLWWLLVFWGIFMIITVRLIIAKNKFSDYFEWTMITVGMYFASFWMRRYAWSMYILTTPLAAFYFKDIQPSKNKIITKTLPFLIFAAIYIFGVFYRIPGESLKRMNWNRYCIEFIKCSAKSAEFLKINKFNGKFLSNYNWGGWLIWNYPDIKPSIDGRMHLWRDQDGYSAFGKYYFLEQNINDIEKSEYDVVYMSSEKPLFNRLVELVREGKWKMVYKDELAGIFVRINNKK